MRASGSSASISSAILTWGYCDLATKARHLKGFEEDAEHLASLGYRHAPENGGAGRCTPWSDRIAISAG